MSIARLWPAYLAHFLGLYRYGVALKKNLTHFTFFLFACQPVDLELGVALMRAAPRRVKIDTLELDTVR